LSRVEDPELYYAFLKAHNAAVAKIQAASPAAATGLSNATAAAYHIPATDLTKLNAEVQKFNVALGAWYLDQQSYLYQQKLAKKTPDINVLVKNQFKRQRLVMNAHAGIHKALPKASWAGLYSYINNDLKASLAATTAGGAK
jgi:hypothetical protein